MKKLEKYYNREYSIKSYYVIKTALIIFVLGIIIWYLAGKTGSVLEFISAVMRPLVLGMVFTYLLSPPVKKIEAKLLGLTDNKKAARVLAVVIIWVIVLLALGLILGVITFTVTRSLSGFNLAACKEYIAVLADQFSKFWTTIEEQLASLNINLGSVGEFIGKIFSGVKTGATTLLFAVIFAIYFLLDEEIRVYWGKALDAFTNSSTREKLRLFIADADRVFSGYIRGQAMDAMLVGVMVTAAMLIARVPYAAVIGILTGLGNLIPYVGPVVGFGSLILVCLAEGSIKSLIIGGIILIVVMFIDGNIINPRMLSSNVEVHPVLVIVALLAGGKVGGIVGMLVAVPVAALLKLQFDRAVERRLKANAAEKKETEKKADEKKEAEKKKQKKE